MDVAVDGRRVRREQNRDAVIDALVDMFHAGIYTPGSAQVAERAGLSPRSLFRYFDDVDDLTRAAIARQLEAAQPLLDPGVPANAPLPERIEKFVAMRVRLHEATAPAARAARANAHRNPLVALQVREARDFLRRQVGTYFGDSPVVDALLSFENYELLRRRLSIDATASALVDALTRLLT